MSLIIIMSIKIILKINLYYKRQDYFSDLFFGSTYLSRHAYIKNRLGELFFSSLFFPSFKLNSQSVYY